MANLAVSVQGAAAGAELWGLEQEQAQGRGSLPCVPCLQAMAMRAWPLPLPVVRILRTSWQEQQRRQQQQQLEAGSRRAVRFRRRRKGEESADWKKEVRESLSRQGSLGLALLSTSAVAKSHISPFIDALRANPIFMSGMLAWALAQTLKVFTTYFVERKWDLKMLLGSGGMPSSHSALCIGLTTSVALCHGVSDALFPVCLGFSLIVMYDATGVRRHAGMQAEILNIIVEDLFQGHPISQRKLKELLGHTPLQVAAGACLGMLVGYACSQSYMMVS